MTNFSFNDYMNVINKLGMDELKFNAIFSLWESHMVNVDENGGFSYILFALVCVM